jgi:hypothetical protein
MLEWLEATSIAVSIRHSTWLYPILEIIHIAGIVALVGAAIIFDLRLLGLSKTIPVFSLADHVLPLARKALFLLVIPSGLLLFISNAATMGVNPVFWIKMLLLMLAIVNTIFFHRLTFTSVQRWNENVVSPPAAKLAAVLSITLWIGVIACGRLLAYY